MRPCNGLDRLDCHVGCAVCVCAGMDRAKMASQDRSRGPSHEKSTSQLSKGRPNRTSAVTAQHRQNCTRCAGAAQSRQVKLIIAEQFQQAEDLQPFSIPGYTRGTQVCDDAYFYHLHRRAASQGLVAFAICIYCLCDSPFPSLSR